MPPFKRILLPWHPSLTAIPAWVMVGAAFGERCSFLCMVDPAPDTPAPAHPPPGSRRIARPLLLAGVILGGVLLCVLLSVWSLVEVIAHANGNWDPPPLHTRVPTETPISTAGAVLPHPPTAPPAPDEPPTAAATPVLPTVAPQATATAARAETPPPDESATPEPTALSTQAADIGVPTD